MIIDLTAAECDMDETLDQLLQAPSVRMRDEGRVLETLRAMQKGGKQRLMVKQFRLRSSHKTADSTFFTSPESECKCKFILEFTLPTVP